MKPTEEHWREGIRSRFAHRECLPPTQAYERFWSAEGMPETEVREALQILESRYGVAAEYFRPDDELSLLLEPPDAPSFLARIAFDLRTGDSQLELQEMLDERLVGLGTSGHWPKVVTVRDFVRAWNGLGPRVEGAEIPLP